MLLAVRQAGSADLVRALRQFGAFFVSADSCRALQRRLGAAGVYTDPINDDCGDAVLRAIDSFRARDP